MLIATVAACLVLLATVASAQPPDGRGPAPVVVAAVERREITTGRSFAGTVVPYRVSTVGSPVEGRVVDLRVRRGDAIEKDQPLAQLRTLSLELELAGAEAELRLRKSELEELKITAPKDIEQAKARMQASEALKEFTQSRAQRTKELIESNAASRDVLQERVSAAAAAENKYLEDKAAWELATSGKWEQQIAQAEARVAIQEETIRKLKDDIAEHTIVAPFDGYITEKRSEVGQWLARGGPVVDAVDVSRIDVEVPVLEDYVSQLQVDKTEAVVQIEALPGRRFEAVVVEIVPQADFRSRSFPVTVRLRQDDTRSGGTPPRPGMFARVTLPVGNRESALMVPKDALVLGKDSTMVWVATPDRAAEAPNVAGVRPVPVELGVADKGWIEVRGPLEPGELVVTEGNERINPTVPVRMTNYPFPADKTAGNPLRKPSQ